MADIMSGSLQSTVSDMGNNAAADAKATHWNTKKFKEEYDALKLRLSDQKFEISKLVTPLRPRASQNVGRI
jgi:hypothetical protein